MKSTFHEALALLFKDRVGCVRGDVAITSNAKFNAELANAVLCVIEEVNLGTNKDAYARVKDWVTSRTVAIHEKGKTPYELPNTLHFVQTANEAESAPNFTGDTRMVIAAVDSLPAGVKVPKTDLLASLEVEGPAFLQAILAKDVPKSQDRLRIPVITTAEKLELEGGFNSIIIQFVEQCLFPCPGNAISFQNFYSNFQSFCPPALRSRWPYDRFRKNIPESLLRGRYNGQHYHIGNVAFDKTTPAGRPLRKVYDKLVEV